MRLVLFFTMFIMVLTVSSCKSQDTPKEERGKNPSKLDTKTTQGRKKTTEFKKKGTTTTPTVSESPGNQNDVPIDVSKSEIIKEDDVETRLSTISYDNVLKITEDVIIDKHKDDDYGNMSSDIKSIKPVQGQKVRLMIQNNHPVAMWYLMPISGEKDMPQDGKFAVNPEAEPPFLGKKFIENEQHLVELIFYGKDGQSFRAFYVEAGTSMLFRNYDLGNYREGDYVPFWSAKELVVDNKIQLKNWLPFSALSSPNVVLQNALENALPEWVNLSKNAVFPKEKMQFIQAEGVQEYLIPVGTIR